MDCKLKRRNDSGRGYSGGHQFSGTVFYGRVVYTMIREAKREDLGALLELIQQQRYNSFYTVDRDG